jgi:nucleoside 2-deoxyribosyltransferase
MKKIYVGCSLQHAPVDFIEGIKQFKESLQGVYEVMEFLGMSGGSAQDVYEKDSSCVRICDFFIADCTYPSTGLGIEIGIAIEQKKPILAIAKNGAKVSRMVLGIPGENFTFLWYNDVNEIVDDIKKIIEMN